MTKNVKVWISLGGVFIILLVITRKTRLLECASESLQGIRYILVLKGSNFKKGDIVSIKDHKVPYTPETNFAKRVLGFPGDRIRHNGNILKIGSYELALLKQTKKGEPLTPLSLESVPQGYVFVGGTHPRSFDSRYEEFGLVPMEKIWGKGVLAW